MKKERKLTPNQEKRKVLLQGKKYTRSDFNSIKKKREMYKLKEELFKIDDHGWQPLTLIQFYYMIFGRNENKELNLFSIEDFELPFEERYNESRDQEERVYKYNSIAIEINKGKEKRNHNWIITQDMSQLEKLKGKEFVITAPITYIGRNRNTANAREMFGMAIDLDYVSPLNLDRLFNAFHLNFLPEPNLITNSGSGVHLYYLLKNPVPMYRQNQEIANEIKRKISDIIWHSFFTLEESKQKQNIMQGFRIPETLTKNGDVVKTYWNTHSDYWSLNKLNQWLAIKNHDLNPSLPTERMRELTLEYKRSENNLEKAKELWPEWYEKRVVKGEEPSHYTKNRKIYDWWLRKCSVGAKEGHRYHILYSIVATGKKCGISKEEIERDCYSLLELFEDLTVSDDNHFLESDVKDALKSYDNESIVKITNQRMSDLTGIEIKPNKRNGLKQKDHLELMVIQREHKYKLGILERPNTKGKSKKKEILFDFFENEENLKLSNLEIGRKLNISRNTVSKWKKIYLHNKKENDLMNFIEDL